jgi:hypothetical protein
MSPEKFIQHVDHSLGSRWNEDRVNQKYTEEEARVATVLSRMDIGLATSLLGYNAKMLNSIRIGVWALVAIGIVHLVLTHF